MSDLVERLRDYEKRLNAGLIEAPYLGEAADEIERLTAENAKLLARPLFRENRRLRAALQDIAAEPQYSIDMDQTWHRKVMLLCSKAREALQGDSDE